MTMLRKITERTQREESQKVGVKFALAWNDSGG